MVGTGSDTASVTDMSPLNETEIYRSSYYEEYTIYY